MQITLITYIIFILIYEQTFELNKYVDRSQTFQKYKNRLYIWIYITDKV